MYLTVQGYFEEAFELHAIIDAVPTASYSTIVNVRAGECSYPVGLARQSRTVRVIASVEWPERVPGLHLERPRNQVEALP